MVLNGKPLETRRLIINCEHFKSGSILGKYCMSIYSVYFFLLVCNWDYKVKISGQYSLSSRLLAPSKMTPFYPSFTTPD